LNKWVFKIVVAPLLYCISYLPFFLLFILSSFFYFIVYYLIRYRRDVVMQNLRRSFPEKTDAEIRAIARKFYQNFCDVIFETIKLLTISKDTFKKRCAMTPHALSTFARYFANNQSIVGVMGHCGNWEWGAISHQLYFDRMITGVYHPLSNKQFDGFMLKLRSRFGGDIVPMHALYKRLLFLREKGISTTIGLIADQTPPPESAYWTTFLNQDTPVFNGPEKLAKKFNYPVVYLAITKKRRGYYELDTEVICELPGEMAPGQISALHTAALERNIKKQPHTWLWSHKRWKHKKPAAIL
jgi:KDO2-lipid IV(A) lauroyltransferase